MLYYELEAGNNTYKLRLNTKNTIDLEKKIGCNPLSIFGDGDTIPTVSVMVAILHASLQQYQHNISINDAYNIFDDYLAGEGNTVATFIPVILEIYKVSGLVAADAGEEEKN